LIGFLTSLVRALYQFTLAYGVIGLAGGTFLESLGIPMAATVIDLTAGLLIINERTTFLEALIVSDLGLVAGSLVSFYLGRAGSSIARYIRRDESETRKRFSAAREGLNNYGDWAVLFGQLFGPARTWISYPAGAMRMDFKKFILYTALGGAAYCAVIIAFSLVFTNFVRSRLGSLKYFAATPLLLIPLLILTMFILLRFVRARKRSRT
jgi:membrane protein DedA with SNARE-associated domain